MSTQSKHDDIVSQDSTGATLVQRQDGPEMDTIVDRAINRVRDEIITGDPWVLLTAVARAGRILANEVERLRQENADMHSYCSGLVEGGAPLAESKADPIQQIREVMKDVPSWNIAVYPHWIKVRGDKSGLTHLSCGVREWQDFLKAFAEWQKPEPTVEDALDACNEMAAIENSVVKLPQLHIIRRVLERTREKA